MTKCALFDIDGTLSDASHRLHYINDKPKHFERFMSELVNDPVIEHVVDVAHGLKAVGYTILLCTARDEGRRILTEDWFNKKELVFYDKIYMRPFLAGGKTVDNRPDMIVKKELLDKIKADGYNPTMVFEDRKRVCDMYLKEGLFVFDVGQGVGDY